MAADHVQPADGRGEMLTRSFGTTLLAGICLLAGLAGIAAFWSALPRTSSTSPLAALFALTWGCTYVVSAVLTWRGSRFAAPIFVAAIGLLLFPARYIVPGGQIALPSFVVITVIAVLGYQYLHGVRERAAQHRL
jgi:hypothetical protein